VMLTITGRLRLVTSVACVASCSQTNCKDSSRNASYTTGTITNMKRSKYERCCSLGFTLRLFFVVSCALPALASGGATEGSEQRQRPNILFCISDDQSHPHASAYGSKFVNTPAFDRVAREGVLFTHAFTASPGCSPSRAAILTGRYPWQLEHAGTHASSFPGKYVVYPDLLEKAGYHVGYTGKGWGPGNFRVSGRERNPAGPAYQKRKLGSPPPRGISSRDYAGNFGDFLKARPKGKPFCFWYGASEPHRVFPRGIGLKQGKKLADAEAPAFLPDVPEIRSDLLDYAVEIEHFDTHLGRMIEMLKERGELDNTIIVVTSDNGMAFPRAKANCYEYGIHMPLAIRWGGKCKGGRTVDDLVSLTDLAPTFLEAAGVEHPGQGGKLAMAGRSLLPILTSQKQGVVDELRKAVFSHRERHSSSRWNNLAYPQRAMRTADYLYIRNFRPERWPAGTPRKFTSPGKLGPEHGGYHDIDACPTLTYMIQQHDDPKWGKYLHWSVDHRPAEELFNVKDDPACLINLAEDPKHAARLKLLRQRCLAYLRETGDPRVIDGGDIFETYKRYSSILSFPKPALAEKAANDNN